jgi:hypothetical protein
MQNIKMQGLQMNTQFKQIGYVSTEGGPLLAFDDSVLAIPIPNDSYNCVSDYVFDANNELYQAKRLLLSKI